MAASVVYLQMQLVALLVVVAVTATASVSRLRVPLDQLVVRSSVHWIALNGTQDLPFSACFETSFNSNWSAIEPIAVELSMPCKASYRDSYVTTFAYSYSYIRSNDHVSPRVTLTTPGIYYHTADVKVPRTTISQHDTFCIEMDSPTQMSCDLSDLFLHIY
jgi:hypothetical protein